MARSRASWWLADKGEVHGRVLEYVQEVERVQSGTFERFLKLDYLYRPRSGHPGEDSGSRQAQVQENVIASNIDTVYAVIAATEVRARFMTDDGDWSTQRRARHLEFYAEGLAKQLELQKTCARAFKSGALKGTGIVHVCVDEFDCIRVERVLVDDIIVDEGESRACEPRQIHRRMFVGREELRAQFPDHEEAIERAQTGGMGGTSWRYWANYRPIDRDELVAIESHKLPIGRRGKKGYQPGRWTIVIDGVDLYDEEYHEAFFPYAVFRWSDDEDGWYGIGLAERIAGHQRTLNKTNWQIDRQLDQLAVPTTYVRLADAALTVKTTNRAGTIVPIKGDYPQTVIPPAVSGETYQRRNDIKSSAFEESGVSRMAAQSTKPAGLDSGVALREYRDQTTQRFAQQEKGFEKLYLDVVWLVLHAAKELGAKAPVVVRQSKHGPKMIEWDDVDMDEAKVQIAAASQLARTPAGRMQLVMEWAQAGIVSQDEARRLMRHPDTERAMSLYTAAIEDIERCIEEILDGEILVPEPYQNLKLGLWRMQMAYLKARDDGAPEEILEALRQWLVQAAFIQSAAEAPAPQLGAGSGEDVLAGAGAQAMPPPMMPPGGEMPMMPGEAPMGPAPQAALAPQAMDLMAS